MYITNFQKKKRIKKSARISIRKNTKVTKIDGPAPGLVAGVGEEGTADDCLSRILGI
jgi:hypothetical protein